MRVPCCCKAEPPMSTGTSRQPVSNGRHSIRRAMCITTTQCKPGVSARQERSKMCTCKWWSAWMLMTACRCVGGTACAGPNLGRDVTPEEMVTWEISIPPDGSGLPPGGGTATAGGAVYNAKCAACHGTNGTGGPADPLVGG